MQPTLSFVYSEMTPVQLSVEMASRQPLWGPDIYHDMNVHHHKYVEREGHTIFL
jgi:hypothetical protein